MNFYKIAIFLFVLTGGMLFGGLAARAETDNQCTQSIDTVIVMDVSNSMGECIGGSFGVPITNLTESQCALMGGDWDSDNNTCTINFIYPNGLGREQCSAVGGTWQDTLLNDARSLASYYASLAGSVSPVDRVAVVSFASNAQTVIGLTDDMSAVQSALNSLQSGEGGTNLGAGLNMAVGILSSSDAPDKKILVFSDGDPTLPTLPADQTDSGDEQEVLNAYSNAQAAGIKIYSFDMNSASSDSNVMEQIAVPGGYFNENGTTADLDNIYESNKYITCPSSTVKVCKMDAETEEFLNGWTITLQQQTKDGYDFYAEGVTGDEDNDYPNGCVVFSEVEPGNYQLTEEMQEGWELSSPESGSFQFSVEPGFDNTDDPFIFVNRKLPPPYCGDGKVNQEWEQCDGEQGCLDTCQWEEQDQCSDLVLARVVVDNVEYGKDAYLTDRVYVGSSDYYVPSGAWFPLYFNGSYFTDPDITSYEDVDGLAVQRLEDSVRLVLYGSRDKNAGDIAEHASGYIEFYNANVTHLRDDKSGNNKLEKDQEVGGYNDGDGSKGGPGDDEVWLEDGRSNFWLSVDVADDGYYTDWQIIEDCRDIITVCKYDTDENPLSGWEINIEPANNLVVNGDFETPLVTDHSGKWQLFTADEVGWNIEWVNDGIDDEPMLELQSSNLWAPASGSQYAELDSHYYLPEENPKRASVSIWQDISTVPGRRYRLTFAFSPRPNYPESDNKLRVQFGDVDELVSADGSGNGNTAWMTYNYTITATDNVTTLRFTDMGEPNSFGTLLDAVKVTEIISDETGSNGCVEFRDLDYGDYTISETNQDNWVQVEPVEGVYQITFDENNRNPFLTFVNRWEEPMGTIRVCKYYDEDNDGEYDKPYYNNGLTAVSWWQKIWSKLIKSAQALSLVEHDTPLSGWNIIVEGEDSSYDGQTNEAGCVDFSVPYGNYTITEEMPSAEGEYWVQTYPAGDGSHSVTINADNEYEEVYFLNVKADIWGCKYNAETEEKMGGWQIELYRQVEPEDDSDDFSWELYQTVFTNNDPESPRYGCYYFAGIDNKSDTYKLVEVAQDNWEQVYPEDYYELGGGEWSNPYDFTNRYNAPSGGGGGGCISGCGGSTPSSPQSPTSSATPTPVVLGYEEVFPEFSKTVDKETINPGGILTYSIKVKNTSQVNLIDVEITDTLPPGFVFADDSSISRKWTVGTLAAGSEEVFVYKVKVSDSIAAGIYANTAKLTYRKGAENDGAVEMSAAAVGISASATQPASSKLNSIIVEAPVEVVPVKVAGYSLLPETGGGDADGQIPVGLIAWPLVLVGLVLVRRSFVLDQNYYKK